MTNGIGFNFQVDNAGEAKIAGTLLALQGIVAEIMANMPDTGRMFDRLQAFADEIDAQGNPSDPLYRTLRAECRNTISRVGGLVAVKRKHHGLD